MSVSVDTDYFITFMIIIASFEADICIFRECRESKQQRKKKHQGPRENGRLETLAEIKHLGSDIKDFQIFCLESLNSAHLCEDVTQGLWFHTAPLCLQHITTFSFSTQFIFY